MSGGGGSSTWHMLGGHQSVSRIMGQGEPPVSGGRMMCRVRRFSQPPSGGGPRWQLLHGSHGPTRQSTRLEVNAPGYGGGGGLGANRKPSGLKTAAGGGLETAIVGTTPGATACAPKNTRNNYATVN